jgi:uroporphyrinogen-III synthase
MKALLTRPRADSLALAEALAARGIETVIEPLLTIRPKPEAGAVLDAALGGAQALLFTSANGVRVFAGACARRELPVFAVGDATARAADAAGFVQVESAQGAATELARLVSRRLKPAAGYLLHPAADQVAGDLAGDLAQAGFRVRRAVIYESIPAAGLSADTAGLLRRREIGAALFFSPRTARSFVRLIGEAGLTENLTNTAAIALSADVAAALRGLAWRRIAVAESPTEPSLLAALERCRDAAAKEERRVHE